MSPLPIYGDRPVVLLTNDDGPPCASSPNIFSFAKLLTAKLGWDVRVVIPDCQKSWVGKAYAISDIISASYFYPLEPDGLTGDITTTPRALKDGETMEWILLSGTPASCTNIALHNLYPGEIDLVVSGPNHGRNTSTAFALSSGTLGAALAGALSIPVPGPSSGAASLHQDHIPCVAVSYGVVTRPVTKRTEELATDVAVDVTKRLWDDWGWDAHTSGKKERVQVYSINIPLVEDALEPENRKVYWTNMWRNTYGQLFKTTKLDSSHNWWANAAPRPNQPSTLQSFATALSSSLQSVAERGDLKSILSSSDTQNQETQSQAYKQVSVNRSKATYDPGDDAAQQARMSLSSSINQPQGQKSAIPPRLSTTSTAGPAALPTPDPSSPLESEQDPSREQLKFHFAPNIKPLLFPAMESLPEGSDGWAFAKGYVSVTPLRAQYAGPVDAGYGFGTQEGEVSGPGAMWR